MHLLVRPEHHADESLESYLLRLSQENGFSSYTEMSTVLKLWMQSHDHDAGGAFPIELSMVNVYHANRSSSFRIRALRLIEHLTEKAPLKLVELALVHSAAHFGSNIKAVHRNSIDIPKQFLRTHGVPVCPQCLQADAYIRQYWHYQPYTACHIHHCQLTDHCPECGAEINYLKSELVAVCECGFHLRYAECRGASDEQIKLSQLIAECHFPNSNNALLAAQNLSFRFGALFWYFNRYKQQQTSKDDISDALNSAITYFENWPENFFAELEQQIENFYQIQIKKVNQTAFAEVFGLLLADCSHLPMNDLSHNFILKTVIDFFIHQVETNPKSKKANIGDVLVTPQEAAYLLSTDIEQIYRLHQEGFITLAITPSTQWHISAYLPIFYLRQIMELRLARMHSQNDVFELYLPSW